MFREVYAYYTRVYAGPDGNMGTAFYVSDVDEEPVLNGVTIPRSSGYTVRKEVEIDLSACSVHQFRGILGEFLSDTFRVRAVYRGNSSDLEFPVSVLKSILTIASKLTN